jgi:hypothetical protein
LNFFEPFALCTLLLARGLLTLNAQTLSFCHVRKVLGARAAVRPLPLHWACQSS